MSINDQIMDQIIKERFYKDIYSIIRQIPPGQVLTYGWLARLAGYPQHSRMAGKALTHAPSSLHLPCHRIVNSQGRLAPGWPEQGALLMAEGVTFKRNQAVDLKKHLWSVVKEF